jgi:hypothetical protein
MENIQKELGFMLNVLVKIGIKIKNTATKDNE